MEISISLMEHLHHFVKIAIISWQRVVDNREMKNRDE